MNRLDFNRFQMVDDFSKFTPGSVPSTYAVYPDGNATVLSNASLVAETPPGGPANISAIALNYEMESGWKFFRVPHSTSTNET